MTHCDSQDIDLGPLGINYIDIFYCQLQGYESVSVLFFICWTMYLIYMLGDTADTYFSPTLGSICEKMKIPYQVAGVTFLAMGNGSPDVFASITSFTGGQDVLIGVGALLGASMFVATIVVGVVSIISPCKIDPFVFGRDISFHVLAVTAVTYCAIAVEVTLYSALGFFVLYAVYVTVVIVGWWYSARKSPSTSSIPVVAGVQAAYWHASSKSSKDVRKYDDGDTTESKYTFLILGEPQYGSRSPVPDYEEEEYEDAERGSDDDQDVTINLSGGLITPKFDHEVLEDYFQPLELKPKTHTLQPFDGVEMDSDRPRKVHKSDVALENGSLEVPLLRQQSSELRRSASRRQNMFLSSIYWQQWQLRRRMQKNILTADWWEYPIHWKIMAIVSFPFVLLRDITIPTVDSELWYKPYAVLQPLCSPLLVLFTAEKWGSNVGLLPAPVLSVIIGIPLAAFVCLTTHYSHPPTGSVYAVLWVQMAFIMCVVWIYLFAGELVACLQAIGIISGIPPAVLGLTILAWGNSVGDLFANMAVAKQGLGEMAIAGSYGGPVLNLCLGLGVSFAYVCTSSFPLPFTLRVDTSSIVSLVFLYIALLSTIVATVFNGFEMKSCVGYYLIGLYVVYSIIQIGFLLF